MDDETTPVVRTSLPGPKSREILESKRLGAEFYIVKPVDFHRFCAVTPRLSCYWRLFR